MAKCRSGLGFVASGLLLASCAVKPVAFEPGKMAGWIAPPERGVNNLAPDYDYVRL